MALTGRFNFRKSPRGKIILQVEEETRSRWRFGSRGDVRSRWRDARSLDLALPALRGLVELRDYIQECPQDNSGSVGLRTRRRWEPEPVSQSGPATPGGGGAESDGSPSRPSALRR